MFTLNVRADVKPLQNKLNKIEKGLGDRALVSALNDTTSQARTQMIRGITAEYAIKASLVRERLQLLRAKKQGQLFTASLIGNPQGKAKRSMNLIHFVTEKSTKRLEKARLKAGKAGGIYLKIRRAAGPQFLRGAFIGNKGRTVFKRVGKERLPIVPAQTIGVPQMFNTKRIQIPVQQWITVNFPRIFRSKADYFLSTVK